MTIKYLKMRWTYWGALKETVILMWLGAAVCAIYVVNME